MIKSRVPLFSYLRLTSPPLTGDQGGKTSKEKNAPFVSKERVNKLVGQLEPQVAKEG